MTQVEYMKITGKIGTSDDETTYYPEWKGTNNEGPAYHVAEYDIQVVPLEGIPLCNNCGVPLSQHNWKKYPAHNPYDLEITDSRVVEAMYLIPCFYCDFEHTYLYVLNFDGEVLFGVYP